MPSGARIRANSVFGTVSDSPLTPGATTFNSNQLVLLPSVVANHAIVTLDPIRQYGDPEIVIVTAHTAAATVATIQRGAYGTGAREHPQGTIWVHALIDEDCIEILTSASRPIDPYRGQMIFETDTDKFVARSVLDVWQDVVPLGAWVSWTPTLIGLSGGTLTYAKFSRVGRIIFFRFKYTFAGAGMGTGAAFTLPVPAHAEYSGQDLAIGQASYADNAAATYPGIVMIVTSPSTAGFQVFNSAGTYAVGNGTTATVPFTWAASDYVSAWGSYEGAT